MEFHHYSVLLNETIENLNIRPDGIYVDGTLGGGGHSYQILKRLGENGRLIGIDQDADAIQAAGERLAEFGNKATLIRSNYANMKEELHAIGVNGVDGIVLDLGVSSFQLDTPERGFTYREPDAPLDFLIVLMHHSICVWMTDRARQRKISSMATVKWTYTVLSVITGKINLQKILQNIS